MIQRMFVTLDTKKTNYKNVGKINHGDDLILELTVLSDGDMISFNDPMVDLLVKKSDGKMIRQNSGIEHIKPNKFVIEVSKDCVTSPGLSTNQLVINDNGRISTCMFYYTILNSLEEDIIQSISNVEVLEQLDEYVIEARERMELLNNDINKIEEFFGATSDILVEAEMARNEAEQKRVQSEILRVNNENDRIEADNIRNQNDSIRNQNEVDRSSSELVREQRESERILNEEERRQNESERMIDESTRQQNENTRQSDESIRMSNETDRKTQENRRVTAETNRVNAETTRRNNENSRISNETERQKAMNEMKSLLEDARGFDERVGVIEDDIEEINSSLDNKANLDDTNFLLENRFKLSFGGKADGVTLDDKALADYINNAENFDKVIELPSGTILVSQNFRITKNLKLKGNTRRDTIIKINKGYNGNLFSIAPNVRIQVEDICFQGLNQTEGHCFFFEDSSSYSHTAEMNRVTIENFKGDGIRCGNNRGMLFLDTCSILNNDNGLYTKGSDNTLVKCNIGRNAVGVNYQGGGQQIHLGCAIFENNINVEIGTNCYYSSFTSCSIDKSLTYGVKITQVDRNVNLRQHNFNDCMFFGNSSEENGKYSDIRLINIVNGVNINNCKFLNYGNSQVKYLIEMDSTCYNNHFIGNTYSTNGLIPYSIGVTNYPKKLLCIDMENTNLYDLSIRNKTVGETNMSNRIESSVNNSPKRSLWNFYDKGDNLIGEIGSLGVGDGLFSKGGLFMRANQTLGLPIVFASDFIPLSNATSNIGDKTNLVKGIYASELYLRSTGSNKYIFKLTVDDNGNIVTTKTT